MKELILYLLIINALSFLLMLIDKQKAKKNRWRIPEAVLLGISALGGSIGGLIGMYAVHHKTRKPLFYIGIPFMLAAQIFLFIICI